jgi:tetratricopeptide (TPR) repeat protein
MGSRPATRRPSDRRKVVRAVAAVLFLAATLFGCDAIRSRTLMNEGNKLYKAQKYDEAIVKYEEIRKFAPDDWGANYQIAVSWLASYHPGSTHPKDMEAADNAIAALERLLAMKAPSPEITEKVRGFYVGILSDANRADKAVEYYMGLLQKEPANVQLILQLAQIYSKEGNFEGAYEYYNKRAQLEPNNKEAWYTLGVICWERSYRGEQMISREERADVVEKGLQAMEKALALDADYFDALSYTNLLYREKAKVFANDGKLDEAQVAWQSAESFVKRALEAKKKQAAAAPAGA